MVDNPDRGDSYVPTAVRVLPSAPELVTNGTFDSDTTGWTAVNSLLSVASNRLRVTNDGATNGYAYQTVTTVVGSVYVAYAEHTSGTGGNSPRLLVGTSQIGAELGTYQYPSSGSDNPGTIIFKATSTTTYITVINNNTTSSLYTEFDNISVKESYIDPSVARYLPRRGHYVYNDQAWTNRGLLLESEARTNLITYSEDFTNVAWAATSSTVTLDVTGPDGQANSAATLLPSSGSAYHFVRYSTGSISTTYTLSVFAKANGYDFLIIGDNLASGAGNQRIAFFDLSNGSVGTIDDNSTGNVLSTTIEDVGNGWYRCSVTYVASSALHDIGVSDSDGARSFTANGTSSILIYGAQLEAGSTPSSYMPTNGATFTRDAETLTVAAADLPSTISPSGGKAALVAAGWTITDGGSV